jgi:protocatechuate 3,4-dioxygenase beta subunit
MEERALSRASLLRVAGSAAAAFGVGGWKKLEDADAGGGPAAVEAGTVSCVLAPEQTEGPYYIPDEKLRRNITEGRSGTPLILKLAVVDASTCKPINGAAVDIWHCDARGVYSGFGPGSRNRTFMRGIQKTDANGLATFQTVYPGWYHGRTVHIHVKVHVHGNVVHTGQLYFPDSLTDTVYRRSPYSKRPDRTTRNLHDFVFANGGKRSMLKLRRRSAGGYVGSIVMGVHRS